MMDRGAARSLEFERCDRGFLFRYPYSGGLVPSVWCFSTIEEAAEWLLEQYRDPPSPCTDGGK